jgi:hypothetical protein
VLITDGSPLTVANPWRQTSSSVLKNYGSALPRGGVRTETLNAICAVDYTGVRIPKPYTAGDKALFPLTNQKIYNGSKCKDGSAIPSYGAQRILDFCEAGWEAGDNFLEPDYTDLSSIDTSIQDAWESQVGRFTGGATPTPTPSVTPSPTPTPLPVRLLRVAP